VDALARKTNAPEADGEVVASRYPDAGIKFAVIAAGDGGNKARLSEETTKEPVKTIARGMPGETGVTVVTTLVCFLFFAREAAGANRAPGIPCALFSRGTRF